MNRLEALFKNKKGGILSIYFTAGYPQLHDTKPLLNLLQKGGVDLVEIGMPYSDPLADGPVIQGSSQIALENGMSVSMLFDQLKGIRHEINIPIILMGYLNPVLKYGFKKFLSKCKEIGVDGLILPDLPLAEYLKLEAEFKANGISNIFLITPETSDERVRLIDQNSNSFIYMVSSSSTTGNNHQFSLSKKYFDRINSLKLENPTMIGFGISDKTGLENAFNNANGAIIGTAFIKGISGEGNLEQKVEMFLNDLKSNKNDHRI